MKNLFNAALLLRDDITTLECVFANDRPGRWYTFVILRDMAKKVEVGSSVIVHNAHHGKPGDLAVCQVRRVHKEPKIDLTVDYGYKFVRGVVEPEVLLAERMTRSMAEKIRERQSVGTRDALLAGLGLTGADMKLLEREALDSLGTTDDDWD